MKKLISIIVVFLNLVSATKSYALEDFADNDSCVAGISIIQRLINNIASIGLFTVYSALFDMRGAEGTRCTIPTNDVKFKFTHGIPSQTSTYTFTSSSTEWWLLPPAVAQGSTSGDVICVKFWTLLFGPQVIGCKYRPDPSIGDVPASCYAGKSCGRNGARNSRSLFPVTAQVLQCVKESLHRIFVDQTPCNMSSESRVNLFPAFQNSMRDAVRAALIIYVALFGMKTVLGGDVPNKGEVFMFFTKFILVLFFSVGIYTGTDNDGRTKYNDGVTKYIKPMFEDATGAFAKMMYDAGGSRGLCVYDAKDYGKDLITGQSYGYLSLWDSIDCRVMHYFGIDVGGINDASGILTTIAAAYVSMILPAFFAFQIMFMILSIIFAVFFLSIVIYFTHVYIIALIALAILIYIAPLFVPFALFSATKGYFDAWLKLMFSFMLQPMIITAFIALMLTVFDQVMYENCEFKNHSISIGGRDLPSFEMVTPSIDPQKCKDSFGWRFGTLKNSLTHGVSAIFFDIVMLRGEVVSQLFSGMITLVLFAVLFYNFVGALSGFAADLTGGPSLGAMAVGPTALMDKVGGLVKAYVKAKLGDKKGAAEELKKVAGKDKKRSGTQASGSGSGAKSSKSDSGAKSSIPGGGNIPGGKA